MNIVTKSIRDRREFFRWLARESLVAFDELRGRPHLRLRDLNELPDAQMLASKPGILPEVEIIVEDCSILARLPQQADAVTLFSRDSIEAGHLQPLQWHMHSCGGRRVGRCREWDRT